MVWRFDVGGVPGCRGAPSFGAHASVCLADVSCSPTAQSAGARPPADCTIRRRASIVINCRKLISGY